jgi:hypothetical protein
LASSFRLVVAVGVDGEDPDEGVTVVDVDEPVDFDDSDLGSGVAGSDVDEFAAPADVAGGADCADVRVGRIVGFGHLVRVREPDLVGVDGGDAVAFGRGDVTDPLVGSAAVVVEPEPVEEFMEMLEGLRGPFVMEPFLQRAVEPFQLAEGLGGDTAPS